MKIPRPVTIDFETFGIDGRPHYPPVPVGVSIKYHKKKARYYGWGHLTGNNCSYAEARAALVEAYNNPDGILCQNSKFDVDVADVHMGLPVPSWDKIHDTMFLLFLDDPHQRELGLKPSAERLLDAAPEERDEVVEWLVANQPVPDVKISASKNSALYAMGFLPYAPGDVVGRYANGDVDRTEALFDLLWKRTHDRGMVGAYDRERRLMVTLLDMERQGVPVDLPRLRKDVELYNKWREQLRAWIIKEIKAPEDINLNSGAQLIDAMVKAKKVDTSKMPLTATGKFQTNKDALLLGVKDKTLLSVLNYLTQLNTCLNTFMQPWLQTAEASNGLIFTTWNQTRGNDVGTRTGRLSSTPNFQNIPKQFDPLFAHEDKKNKALPTCPFKGLPPLPKVRSYVVPFKGDILIDRDYSQQEPRILAHFDGGQLMRTYQQNPWVDFHDYAKDELAKVGKFYERKPVKNTNLGLIYGMGAPTLAEKNDMTVEAAKELRKHILELYPGLSEMYKEMKMRAKSNQPIRTWGGREYYCEPPKLVNGRIMEFDYKLVNVLIQGSAADCTKEGIIRFDDARKRLNKPQWKLILNVHDQITASVPKREWRKAMEVLRECMESVEFEVPILSEGAISSTNWAELIDSDKKGKAINVKNN